MKSVVEKAVICDFNLFGDRYRTVLGDYEPGIERDDSAARFGICDWDAGECSAEESYDKGLDFVSRRGFLCWPLK